MAERTYTDDDLDAAIAAIAEPGRLQEAQDLVSRAAPSLQRVLNAALQEGGWFDEAHQRAVREAAGGEDPSERVRAVQTLIADETKLGMFVGVAVGFGLARELERAAEGGPESADARTGGDPESADTPTGADPESADTPTGGDPKPTTQED